MSRNERAHLFGIFTLVHGHSHIGLCAVDARRVDAPHGAPTTMAIHHSMVIDKYLAAQIHVPSRDHSEVCMLKSSKSEIVNETNHLPEGTVGEEFMMFVKLPPVMVKF
jgi:hypothetical protein